MNMQINKKVALYIRVSSEEQKKEGLSLDAQKNKLISYCNLKEWSVYKIYLDEGISAGSIKKRPQFKQILSDSKKKLFSTIVITKFDRAFRNTADAVNTFNDLKNIGIDFVSISEDIDTTTATGHFFFIIISALAELERKMTSERNKAIMEDKFNKGMFLSRSHYGYKPLKKEGKIVGFKIHQKEAEVVLDCFKSSENGESYLTICKRNKIKPQQYYNIIKNKVYCGYITFEGIEKRGLHKPIISEELFNKLQN